MHAMDPFWALKASFEEATAPLVKRRVCWWLAWEAFELQWGISALCPEVVPMGRNSVPPLTTGEEKVFPFLAFIEILILLQKLGKSRKHVFSLHLQCERMECFSLFPSPLEKGSGGDGPDSRRIQTHLPLGTSTFEWGLLSAFKHQTVLHTRLCCWVWHSGWGCLDSGFLHLKFLIHLNTYISLSRKEFWALCPKTDILWNNREGQSSLVNVQA